MKLVIFEGLDNIGKSTVINEYAKHLRSGGVAKNRICVIHFDHPAGSTREDMIRNIDMYNLDMCGHILDLADTNSYDYCLLDRSWYSEYVYGTIYRKREKDDMVIKLQTIEQRVAESLGVDNVTMIRLTCDTPDFVIAHEDGKSLSYSDDMDSRRGLIEMEDRLFAEVFDASVLPDSCKAVIVMNTGMAYNDIEITIGKVDAAVSRK